MMSMGEDRAIRDHPHTIIVYMHLIPHLDFVEFRRVRISKVSAKLGLHKRTVMNALDLLVQRGYLEEGPRTEDNVRTFRLRWSLPAAA
jgi:DNA-binding IclR family transcriptional regulator